MALWRLYYHLIWATKERQPLIQLELEAPLYNYIIGKADAKSCIVHAIGGIEDHVHLVVSIPPHISIADFVKNLKGSSSHYFNTTFFAPKSHKFAWQEGYGVFSLGSKQLEQAVIYVQNQKTHHSQKTAIAYLEQVAHEDDPPKYWHQT
ncbi:IS200/IS605 family transposase [Merismopedia glauca]|uniref:IS200/IS605 family transposase n=1 Tax=Merismopedia glauca CCAP 1448/3 TaxID=1296344 RepID=A0A2T1BX86_9CYAN|nr:IS200/IS605 family transposase [Merismopedia glauca CCAP 1448/3]